MTAGNEPAMRIIEAREGGVLVLTLDYPARRNALALPLRAGMLAALEAAQGDLSTRAVVIAGAGAHFSSGGDISGMEIRNALQARERMRQTHRLVRLLVAGRVPVVAAVEGFCVGAGLSLACACDTIVAAEDAQFAGGFGRIGLMADLGLPHTLPLRVGMGRARQILLYHERMDAAAAERIGLIDRVVPRGAAMAAAMDRARGLARQAPAAVALTRQILAEGLERALEQERHYQSTLFLTADFTEGRDAFLNKREAVFKGE
jgi:enoyl-CoA hydratase/carnithine racemase